MLSLASRSVPRATAFTSLSSSYLVRPLSSDASADADEEEKKRPMPPIAWLDYAKVRAVASSSASASFDGHIWTLR